MKPLSENAAAPRIDGMTTNSFADLRIRHGDDLHPQSMIG